MKEDEKVKQIRVKKKSKVTKKKKNNAFRLSLKKILQIKNFNY